MRPFRFGVTMRTPRPANEWRAAVRQVDDLGFDVLTIPDHLAALPQPIPALAAAAAASDRLRLGTMVLNNDFRNPVVLAHEVASLDQLCDGRFELGMGAGHAFPEYEQAGIPFDPAGVRVDRLVESVDIVMPLLRGETVTTTGAHYDVHGATLHVNPVQQPPPLLIGGWGPRLLDLAAPKADIVGLTGLGRTKSDGNTHAPDGFTAAAVDERVAYVRERAAGRDIELHAIVQMVAVTDDALGVATATAHEIEGVAPEDLLACPFVLIGTESAIVDELHAHRERWGISYFSIFEQWQDTFAPVVARIAR